MDNLRYYNEGRAVPQEAKKSFNNGKFSGTDINPMWRIKKLTEMFGPAGIGWYTEIVSERAEVHGETTIAVVDLNLYVKDGGEWSKPIYGTGGNVLLRKGGTSDEGYKMAYTDALSVACKALGIGADVYFEKDKTKYTATSETTAPQASAPAVPRWADKPEPAPLICAACGQPIGPWKAGKMTAEEFAEKTRETYGRPVCFDCSRALKKAQANETAD